MEVEEVIVVPFAQRLKDFTRAAFDGVHPVDARQQVGRLSTAVKAHEVHHRIFPIRRRRAVTTGCIITMSPRALNRAINIRGARGVELG